MNKIILAIVISIINCLFVESQIGINTIAPKGIIDINTGSEDSIKDDVIIKINSTGEANVIIGGIDDTSLTDNTSLALNDSTKGLLLNVVSLKSTNDTVTIVDPLNGMIVYNTHASDTEEASDVFNVKPGLYFHQDNLWRRLYSTMRISRNAVAYIRDLGTVSNVSAIGTDNFFQPTQYITDIETGAGATTLYTRLPSTDNTEKGSSSFEVPESGSFVFIIRWYGHPYARTTAVVTDYNYYAYIFKSGESTPLTYTLVKPWLTSNFSTSFSIMATPHLEKGDVIEIRIGQEDPAQAAEWRLISHEKGLANRTSFVYFKYL